VGVAAADSGCEGAGGILETSPGERPYGSATFGDTVCAGGAHVLDLSTLEDRELVERARAGIEDAYRELLRRYERPVFSLVFRVVRDRNTAEDLSQEAFGRAFHAIGTYDPSFKFSSWIFKIANNLTIDHLRRRKLDTVSIEGSPHADTREALERSRIDLEATGENPEQFTENRELGSHIEQAIAKLRPEYRTAVLLRHVEGYGYEEVAEIMEVPLGTAKTFIHRGRMQLKQLLASVAS
jgi:RNA polymerase sigma-70 factor (ECF subfamily)